MVCCWWCGVAINYQLIVILGTFASHQFIIQNSVQNMVVIFDRIFFFTYVAHNIDVSLYNIHQRAGPPFDMRVYISFPLQRKLMKKKNVKKSTLQPNTYSISRLRLRVCTTLRIFILFNYFNYLFLNLNLGLRSRMCILRSFCL